MIRLSRLLIPAFAAMALATAVSSCGSASRATSARYRGDVLYGDDDRRGDRGRGKRQGSDGRRTPPIIESFAKGLSDPLEKALVSEIEGWLGTPYQWGGHSKEGTDCSGMVMEVYNKVTGLKLPRVSREQSDYVASLSRGALQPGDLLFFSGDTTLSEVSHVGMYVGRGQMIHASVSRGVVVSDVNIDYWTKRLCNAGRVAGALTAWRDRGGETSRGMQNTAVSAPATSLPLVAQTTPATQTTQTTRQARTAQPVQSADVPSAQSAGALAGKPAILPHEAGTSVGGQADPELLLEMAITQKADSIFSSRFMD